MAARIMCLIILALEARGLYISISDRRWKIFAYLRERETSDFNPGMKANTLSSRSQFDYLFTIFSIITMYIVI